MIKKYAIPIFTLLVLVSFVLFYFYKWNSLTKATDEVYNISNHKSLTGDVQQINMYVSGKLKELENERDIIINSLFASVVVLILFGIAVYVREIILNINIAKLKNELQQFADALNESAIVSKTDTQGFITYVNDKFCNISGYSKEELIGKNHNIIRHKDMKHDFFKGLWSTIKHKKIFKATILNMAKDGREYYVDSIIIPMLDMNNEITEYLAVRYDVTQLKESINKAVLAQKVKDEFMSNMSHELRTPLNAIVGFSNALKKDIADEKQQKYLRSILDSSENLILLINDILDISKLKSGKFTLDYHRFNLWDNIKALSVRFDSEAELAGVNMSFSLDESLKSEVEGDWLRISQIITNLMSNAMKFTPKGNNIIFNAKYDSEVFHFSLEDEGIGMSKEVQKKIFKPFEQADTSTTRKYGGTGLGLSIVLSLVEQMSGEINLVSVEAKGSKFELSIPMKKVTSSDSDSEEDVESEQTHKELNGHILVAEDNKTNQMLIGMMLDDFGLTYTIVNDGLEAVEEFSNGNYDLILMDEDMPNLNGTSAMKKIKEKYDTKVPVIALTASSTAGDKERFLKAGMSEYIAKPIDIDILYTTIKKFIDTK